MKYTPDRWVLLEITRGTEKYRKVFAGWYGGYLGSDTWKVSSGVVSIVDEGDYYEFINESGSLYQCYKNNVGMSNYMVQVYEAWIDSIQEDSNIKIEIINSDLI